jgi:hypothetical protein
MRCMLPQVLKATKKQSKEPIGTLADHNVKSETLEPLFEKDIKSGARLVLTILPIAFLKRKVTIIEM